VRGSDPLKSIHALAAELESAPWFTRCAGLLGGEEQREVEQYLCGLQLPAFRIERVSDWAGARATTQRADWSREWWDSEAREAGRLKSLAATRLGEVPLLAGLSELTEAAASLYEPAAMAAASAGVEDQVLIRVAAGAGAMAAHQMGLVLAAEAGADHALACKYRLFSGGRWLLGVMGECCYLF